MSDVSRILRAADVGDPQAAEQLLPLVYNELRNLAAAKLARERSGLTLQTTALVHEAYLRLVDRDCPQSWDSRRHFFAAAAEAMRRIIIEGARRKGTVKYGGRHRRVGFEVAESLSEPASLDLIALDEALQKLSQLDPPKAQLVKLRFFAGLTMKEAADALGVSVATAERQWTYARTWLYAAMSEGQGSRPEVQE